MTEFGFNIWIIIGLGLLILETIIPGVFIMWFGIGALITSLLTGLFPDITQQLFLFVVISLSLLVIYVKFFKNKMEIEEEKEQQNNTSDYLVNKTGVVVSSKRVKVGDTEWIIANQSIDFKEGEKVIIKEVIGSSLKLERIA